MANRTLTIWALAISLGVAVTSSPVAAQAIEDAPAPVEAPGDPSPREPRIGDPSDDAPKALPPSDARINPLDALGPGFSPFLYGSLALLTTEFCGLTTFVGGSVIFVLTAAVALGGGSIPAFLGLLAAYVGLLVGLCGFGPATAIGSAGAAAAGAEMSQRSGLPFFLGSIPGVAIGVVGGIMAGLSFIVIGPVGYLTQGLALFSGSTEGLPVELLAGFALQAAAGPIALAGGLGAAYFLGNIFDDAMAEESIDLKAKPSVAQAQRPIFPVAAQGVVVTPGRTASMRF